MVRYAVYFSQIQSSTKPRQHTLDGRNQSCSEQHFKEPNWPNHTQTGKTPSSRIQPISAWRTSGNNACQRNETLRIRYGVHTPRTSYDTSMVTDNGVCTLCKHSGHAKTSITLQPQQYDQVFCIERLFGPIQDNNHDKANIKEERTTQAASRRRGRAQGASNNTR